MAARDEIAGVTAQLGKVQGEFTAAISRLETRIAEGAVTTEDLAPLKAAAQALDDLNPDAPVDPAPEPPAEPTVDIPAEPIGEVTERP